MDAMSQIEAERASLFAENQRKQQLEQQCTQLLATLTSLVYEVQGLMDESVGVAGFHMNGDMAPWHELVPGGQFERLSSLDEAADLIDQMKGHFPC